MELVNSETSRPLGSLFMYGTSLSVGSVFFGFECQVPQAPDGTHWEPWQAQGSYVLVKNSSADASTQTDSDLQKDVSIEDCQSPFLVQKFAVDLQTLDVHEDCALDSPKINFRPVMTAEQRNFYLEAFRADTPVFEFC